ncbi:MAG: hypothetical protein C0506_11275 [Anaerolinea sp.]|nr:hypothetical protein [Anaerolinea sp.]
MDWLGPSLISILGVLLGGGLAWFAASRTAAADRADAAQVRTELRNEDRRKEAEEAARRRNRETRLAIEELFELGDQELTRDKAQEKLNRTLARTLQFARVYLRLRARLPADQQLAALLTELTSLLGQRDAILTKVRGGEITTDEAGSEWRRILGALHDNNSKFAAEMERLGWDW